MGSWFFTHHQQSLHEQCLINKPLYPLTLTQQDNFVKAFQVKTQSIGGVLLVFAPSDMVISMECLVKLAQSDLYNINKGLPTIVFMDRYDDNFFWSTLSRWPHFQIQIMGVSSMQHNPVITMMLLKAIDYLKDNYTQNSDQISWQDRIVLFTPQTERNTTPTLWEEIAYFYNIPILHIPNEEIQNPFCCFGPTILFPGIVAGLSYEKIMACAKEALFYIRAEGSNSFLQTVSLRLCSWQKTTRQEKFYVNNDQLHSWALWYQKFHYTICHESCSIEKIQDFDKNSHNFNYWTNGLQSSHGLKINYINEDFLKQYPQAQELPHNLYEYNNTEWQYMIDMWSKNSSLPCRLFRLQKPSEESLAIFWVYQILEGFLLQTLCASLDETMLCMEN